MRIGVGLPTTSPGIDRDLLLDWVRGLISTSRLSDPWTGKFTEYLVLQPAPCSSAVIRAESLGWPLLVRLGRPIRSEQNVLSVSLAT